MSERTARTHNHSSNRAKIRDGGERRVVFKGVLDNPFRIQWPSVPFNIQNTVLANTLTALDGIALHQMNRKRRRNPAEQQEQRQKKKKKEDKSAETDTPESSETQTIGVDGSVSEPENEVPAEQPAISKHLVIGINEVTKRLESQIRHNRLTVITASDKPVKDLSPCPLRLIVVCRADINPPILIDHLPHLVAAYNSLKPQVMVQLVPLPIGAELLLSRAVGLRRAAVLGIDSNWPDLDTFLAPLSSVQTLTATWLASSVPLQKFVPTHIKQIRTSTPKDMKAEKQRRKEEKARKKEVRGGHL